MRHVWAVTASRGAHRSEAPHHGTAARGERTRDTLWHCCTTRRALFARTRNSTCSNLRGRCPSCSRCDLQQAWRRTSKAACASPWARYSSKQRLPICLVSGGTWDAACWARGAVCSAVDDCLCSNAVPVSRSPRPPLESDGLRRAGLLGAPPFCDPAARRRGARRRGARWLPTRVGHTGSAHSAGERGTEAATACARAGRSGRAPSGGPAPWLACRPRTLRYFVRESPHCSFVCCRMHRSDVCPPRARPRGSVPRRGHMALTSYPLLRALARQ